MATTAQDIAAQWQPYGKKLASGDVIPAIGFGTYALPEASDCIKAVAQAIVNGYRLIDGAAFYNNETYVGRGLRLGVTKAGLKREDIFVTSKVWPTHLGYQKTMDAFFKTLNDLDIDYLDLYLIHWPASAQNCDNWEERNLATWRAMAQLYSEGYVRSIGVSNFKEHHLRALLDTSIPPMVNQLEVHPGYSQESLRQFCRMQGIVVEGWSPFGRNRLLSHELIVHLAAKYQCTPAQLCLRWALQLGVIPLPKSAQLEHMRSNLNVLGFEISPADMQLLLDLDREQVGYSGEDSDTVRFGM